ncbi:hypothetical protein BKA56DRAFT_604443 [Ilyonectria sp. MPI-CAGE-AT-0026]|nr:hypothetical protein BKA56DRAFT_604443 [Ilyonectria sp. MPI-CAGE-AT-0026]
MDQDPLKWVLFDWPSSSHWNFSGGKVALLEDAANAMCPHQGMPSLTPSPLPPLVESQGSNQLTALYLGDGAGQALEDGYIIRRALGDFFKARSHVQHPSLEYWLNKSIRYPRSEKVQQTSREAGDM